MFTGLRLAVAASVMVAFVSSAAADTAATDAVAGFYKGKQIRLVIGVGAGEAYDIYARILARHMPKYIPGNPVIVPQNQLGAGSLNAINSLYNTAARDGTAFGTGNRFIPMMPLLSVDGARFDPLKFSYIGSMNREIGVCVVMKTAGFHTIDDLKAREIIVGTAGAGAELTHFTATLRSMLGAKMKLISGYRTSNDINAAIDKGELDGRCGVSYSGLRATRPQWLADKKVDLLLQLGLAKDKDLPDVPLISDFVATERDRQALELMLAPAEMGRPFLGPPDIPPARLTALRAAFDASMKDATLLQEAKKAKLEIEPMSGADMEALVARLYEAPTAVIERARTLIHTGE